MNYRYMGRTGLRVSELCLGAMTFGRESSIEESMAMLNRFAEAGGNFIDTANVYGQGTSEEIVGRWLQGQKREDWVIATKVRFGMGLGPNAVGLSRKHILDQVAQSLKRLGTDYLDLYQIHCWDSTTPITETLATLNDLVRRGWVRYVGASNLTGWQLQKAILVAQHHGWETFSCLQPQYNLLCRHPEWELVPVCLNEGVGIIPWSPLRGGWLSGKYRRGMSGPPQGSRVDEAEKKNWGEKWSNLNTEATWRVIDALHHVAQHSERPAAQVALNWLLQKPGVTAPIVGARTLGQLEANLGASGWTLSPEHLQQLDEASQPAPEYPYNLADWASAGR